MKNSSDPLFPPYLEQAVVDTGMNEIRVIRRALPLGLKMAASVLLFMGASGMLMPLVQQPAAVIRAITTDAAYFMGFLSNVALIVAGAGLLRGRAWARPLALVTLVWISPPSISGAAMVCVRRGYNPAISWLVTSVIVVAVHGLLFYLIYRKSSADALLSGKDDGSESTPNESA
jgi:hypothetical protein